MIYRCRWCEKGYCEDCLDWEKTTLLGENLKEYEMLDFPAIVQAFYISCPNCADHHAEQPESKAFCETMSASYDKEHAAAQLKRHVDGEELKEELGKATRLSSRPESLTDAATVDDSGLTTPRTAYEDGMLASTSVKRKAGKTASGMFKTKIKRIRLTM